MESYVQTDDEDVGQEFEAEDDLESLLEESNEAARKRGNARAYEIRRHLEDLEEKRRFQELFEDLD